LGTLQLIRKKNEIQFEGVVNQDSGMIELVACAPLGKTHESIFVWNIVPYHLQVSMLLLGLNSGKGVSVQGDTTKPTGDSVNVFINWEENGKHIEHQAEEFVWDITHSQPMQKHSWIFTGSEIINGMFMADQERSLLTTYRDPFTIIDNPLAGGTDDTVYRVNEKLIPKKGTKVYVRIEPAK